jgi:hypothetical protein
MLLGFWLSEHIKDFSLKGPKPATSTGFLPLPQRCGIAYHKI